MYSHLETQRVAPLSAYPHFFIKYKTANLFQNNKTVYRSYDTNLINIYKNQYILVSLSK